MAKVIAIVNQKGGVGKTTTAINLSAGLAEAGKFILLLDLDPQANASSGLGIDHKSLDKSLYDVLMGGSTFRDIVMATNHIGFRIAPSSLNMAGANVELINIPERENVLRNSIIEIRGFYDYIIIDCPPSLGILTVNALSASDEVIIPVQAEYFALEGLSQLWSTIELVKTHLNPDLNVKGALLTMFEPKQKLSQAVFHELYHYFPGKIFRSVIPRIISLAEAPSHGKTIFHYDPGSRGARSYERLSREILSLEES